MAQKRQKDRRLYFKELAETSNKYFIPYISQFKEIRQHMKVLEIGCGDGGNLLPFSRMGCNTLGIDIAECRIKDAILFFKENNAKGEFILSDIFKMKEVKNKFDLIICHDVFEHIENKQTFLQNIKSMLNIGGGDFHVFSCLANAFWGTSANLQK